MSSPLDESDFVDSDFQAAQKAQGYSTGGVAPTGFSRPPSREELDAQVNSKQREIAEIKRALEQKERERATVEESRRRQVEFHTGREEMVHHLTRGLALMQESEFSLRRDAEQMAKTIAGLNDALAKVQSIQDETWTDDNWSIELTRALTTLENARMEWNSARLKWPVLDMALTPEGGAAPANSKPGQPALSTQDFRQLSRVGLAYTWPLVLLLVAIFLVLLLRR
jgi:hypothetical protein